MKRARWRDCGRTGASWERRLAAIFTADVAGYSRLVGVLGDLRVVPLPMSC
jgi:hypothetical protein